MGSWLRPWMGESLNMGDFLGPGATGNVQERRAWGAILAPINLILLNLCKA